MAQANIATTKASEASASAAAALLSEQNAAASEAAAAASAAAAATFDPALYAALADNETVTGQYTFSHASGILIGAAPLTATLIGQWNTAYSWGNHASAGYLTSFTESDPTVGAHIKAILAGDITNWNTAFGWGNHASAGYAPTASPTFTGSVNMPEDLDCPYGIHGGYADDTTNFGATIWALDIAFSGGAAGNNSASTSVYGLRWLRNTHTDASMNEGLYAMVNGASYYEFGTLGALFKGSNGIYLNDTNTKIAEGSANAVRIQTNSGYVDIGPQNTSWMHMTTDRASFYFSKPMSINGVARYHNLGAMPYHGSSSYLSAKITFSTSAASGGSSGDIWYKYT